MNTLSLAVIDYEAGNLRSVVKALEAVGGRPRVTRSPKEVPAADALVFPGQGACHAAMSVLEREGLADAIRSFLRMGKPFLGVCLGLQLLFETSEEGDTPCLGIFPGRVKRLPHGLKVPHMGWNQVRFIGEHPVFRGIPQESHFYFVHSYYPDPADPAITAAITNYGIPFCSAAARGNLVATQFHPEKSGAPGLQLYRNFLQFAQHGA